MNNNGQDFFNNLNQFPNNEQNDYSNGFENNYSNNLSQTNYYRVSPMPDNLPSNQTNRNNKKIKLIILGVIIVGLIIVVVMFVFKNNDISDLGGKSNSKIKITKTIIKTSAEKIRSIRVLTNDNEYYIYDDDTQGFEKEELPFKAKESNDIYYLSTDGNVYLNYEEVQYMSPVKFNEKYVKLYSGIKEMSASKLNCAVFLDKNNDALAYNLITYNSNVDYCAFNASYDFDAIMNNVKHVVAGDNLNGYVDNNDNLYIKLTTQSEYKELLENVKDVSNFPYVLTNDGDLYLINVSKEIHPTEELTFKKIDTNVKEFKNCSLFGDYDIAYVVENKLFIPEIYIGELLTHDNGDNYLSVASANEVKEIIYYNGQFNNKKFVYADYKDKLHLYDSSKEIATYNYDLEGLEKVIEFANND